MVVYGLEDLLGGDQQGCHFPDGHLKVHLGELEEPVDPVSQRSPRGTGKTYLLKKRGMRTLDPRLGVEPKLAGPACWRGTEMCGFMIEALVWSRAEDH